MTRRLIFAALLLSLPPTATGETGWPRPAEPTTPRNFVYFGLDRHRVGEDAFLSNPGVVGAQLRYTWRELEPERGRYELGAVLADLELLEARGKSLWIQVQDLSFSRERVNVPGYLTADPAYNGGAALWYEDDGEAPAVADGWIARRWDPAVRARFAALLQTLGRALDGRIEGLNLAETAISFGTDDDLRPPGYSPRTYYEGIKALLSEARAAFERSHVVVYANFMPGEALPDDDRGYLRGVYRHAERIGVGVGGPDLLPHRPWQRLHSYPLIAGRAPGTIAGSAVQWGNLADLNRETGRRVTVDELYRFASRELALDYIFWGVQEPYYSDEILPFLSALAGR